MTQFWTVNYICQVFKLKLLFRTCLKFWTRFILIGSYFQLLLNIFYRRSTAIVFGTVFLDSFWRLWKLFFLKKIFSVLLYLCCFFYPKTINFINSGIVSNVLSTGLQYTLSFKWPDFGLKCLVTITPKSQSLKFKTIV